LWEDLARHWDESDLDDRFRAYAPRAITEYPVLHDQEARPAPAGPYCVVEIAQGFQVARYGGTRVKYEHLLQKVPLQFRIHASREDIVVKLCRQIALRFDGFQFKLPSSDVVCFSREDDFGVQEDDEHWVWVLPYLISLETEILLSR